MRIENFGFVKSPQKMGLLTTALTHFILRIALYALFAFYEYKIWVLG